VALLCLVVDDNARFLEAVRDLLEREGIVVDGASTGAEALQRFDELRPDVTLVDIDLGQESGFDVAQQIAAASDGERAKVILISAYAETDFGDMVATSAAVGFLPKHRVSGSAIREILGSTGDQFRAARD
jgi:CheY-like chemotaxis protein